jgi:hypothetical protein
MFNFPDAPTADQNYLPSAACGWTYKTNRWDRGQTPVTPVLTALVPNKGPTNSATENVRVQGTGFLSTSVVKFGATLVPGTFVSTTEITAFAPSSPTAGPVNVTVTNGTLVSNALPYTYETPAPTGPTITSINPPNGPINDNTIRMTVNGTGYTAFSIIFINSSQVTSTFVSATQLTCMVPVSSTAKTVNVNVIEAGMTSNTAQYTYISGVTVTDVQPNPAPPTSTGTYVNVYGTGFDASTWIQMNPSGPASAGPSYSTELVSSTHVRTRVNTWTMGQGTTWNVNATGSSSPDIVWQIAPYP